MEASHAPPQQANKAPGGLGPVKVPRPSLARQAATTRSAGSLVPSAQPGHSAGLPALPLQRRTCWHAGRVCRMWLRAGLAAPVCSPGWPHLQNFLWPSPECQSHSGLPRDRRSRPGPTPWGVRERPRPRGRVEHPSGPAWTWRPTQQREPWLSSAFCPLPGVLGGLCHTAKGAVSATALSCPLSPQQGLPRAPRCLRGPTLESGVLRGFWSFPGYPLSHSSPGH